MEIDVQTSPHLIRYEGKGLKIGRNGGRIANLRIYSLTDQNFPSVAIGDDGSLAMSCPGVVLGDIVLGVSANVDLGTDAFVVGRVSAADTVTVVLHNGGAGALDLAATVDWEIVVLQKQT